MACTGEGRCFICLDDCSPLIASGCACREDAALAHLDCRIKAAEALAVRAKDTRWWRTCQTCEQEFTGPMSIGLARAWWSRVLDRPQEDLERLSAAQTLANALSGDGKYEEAEEIERAVLAVEQRVLWPEHPDTLISASNLGTSLFLQGKYAEAVEIESAVLVARKRVLGAEHPDTLAISNNLTLTLFHQGNHRKAEQTLREVLTAQTRVLGAKHLDTLTTMNNLGMILSDEGKHAEAEEMQREVLAVRMRVLGAEHPDTLTTLLSLASSLFAKASTRRRRGWSARCWEYRCGSWVRSIPRRS